MSFEDLPQVPETPEGTYSQFEVHLLQRLTRIETMQGMILQRVDTINGKVAAHEKEIQKQILTQASEAGSRKASLRYLSAIFAGISTLFGGLGAALAMKFFK